MPLTENLEAGDDSTLKNITVFRAKKATRWRSSAYSQDVSWGRSNGPIFMPSLGDNSHARILAVKSLIYKKPKDVPASIPWCEASFLEDWFSWLPSIQKSIHEKLIEAVQVKDVTPLLEKAGIVLKDDFGQRLIRETAETYPTEPIPEDNWIFSAFKGLVELKKCMDTELKARSPEWAVYRYNFATIGTGSGLDMIGAYEIFSPPHFVVTDLNEGALKVARENLDNNIHVKDYYYMEKSHFLQGSLASPLIEKGIKVDVLYANLPNIPADQVETDQSIASATYIDRKTIEGCPKKYDDYLLATQYHFLKQAQLCLEPHGSVVIALGGRVPYELVKELFAETGFEMKDLYGRLKVQTQPEDVIKGYAEMEQKNDVDFIFYDMGKKEIDVSTLGFDKNIGLEDYQKAFSKNAISAQEAYRRHLEGHKIAHAVWILRGVPVDKQEF